MSDAIIILFIRPVDFAAGDVQGYLIGLIQSSDNFFEIRSVEVYTPDLSFASYFEIAEVDLLIDGVISQAHTGKTGDIEEARNVIRIVDAESADPRSTGLNEE